VVSDILISQTHSALFIIFLIYFQEPTNEVDAKVKDTYYKMHTSQTVEFVKSQVSLLNIICFILVNFITFRVKSDTSNIDFSHSQFENIRLWH